jgi:hypothetical protein
LLDCYIVRVYRKQADDPNVLVGLLEEVGKQGKRAFASMGELCELLAQGGKESGKSGRDGETKTREEGKKKNQRRMVKKK